MSGYTIPEDTDVTKFYLKKVLSQNAPSLGKLSKCFEDINIDRVMQTFIDSVITPTHTIKTPEEAMYLSGQLDMAMRFKKFFSNLHNISEAIADGTSLSGDDVMESLDVISPADQKLADKISKGKK